MVHLNPKLTLNLGLPLIELTIQAHAGWFKVDAQAAIPLGSAGTLAHPGKVPAP